MPARSQASLTIAMIIPITTKTTIAACIQIQVGDIGCSLAPAIGIGASRHPPRLSCGHA
jgi:hypothetical protein